MTIRIQISGDNLHEGSTEIALFLSEALKRVGVRHIHSPINTLGSQMKLRQRNGQLHSGVTAIRKILKRDPNIEIIIDDIFEHPDEEKICDCR